MQDAQTDSAPWTVKRLLNWTREYFERAGLDSPRLCAEILLAHAMNRPRIQLFTAYETAPDADTVKQFRDLIRRAADHTPIAYLTGTKEFFSLAFRVTPDVLIPRPETEILVERIIDLCRRADLPQPRILDLGTGSGCIAVALAKYVPEATIVATDIAQPALDVARQNAQTHDVAERITFLQGDLYAPLDADADAAPFDIIVSNPPYIAETDRNNLPPNVRDHEPHTALFAGPDGLNVIRRLISGAPDNMKYRGHLLIEVAYNQAATARNLLAQAPWQDIVSYRDGGGHERVLHARPNKNNND